MQTLEKSLVTALNWARVTELPKVDDGEHIWVRAIGLTTRKTGQKSYVGVIRGRDGSPRIVADFCPTLQTIHSLDEVYPFLYLDESQIPKFSTNDKETRISWLRAQGMTQDYSSYTLKQLNKEIVNVVCMKLNKV